MTSFEANAVNFPDGLRECIRTIKEKYNVSYVGVWMTITGYWSGIEPGSELYEAQKENLVFTRSGLCIPSPEYDKALSFWDAYCRFLKDCGVDFLKVDNQSSLPVFAEGMMPTVQAAKSLHKAIDKCVFKYFDGALINCMGMDLENVLSRPRSAISRNSDDFYPGKDRGFIDHLLQNAYNAMWHQHLYYCDYDMWWSNHDSAVNSGVLRAISASPIYVSDSVGITDRDNIMPTVEDDGSLMRCDNAAVPTKDCIFADCRTEDKLMKIWNRSGNNFAIAAFNINDKDVSESFTADVIPDAANGRYVAYEYFTKKYSFFSSKESLSASLVPDGHAVWSIYEILSDDEGEYILEGSHDKYVPIASRNKTKKYVRDIL